jgi:hypothetical protein
MKIKNSVLRLLIKELLSPVGDSEAELMTDITEVVEVLEGIASEATPTLKMKINDAIKNLNASSIGSPREIAAAISRILTFINEQEIDAPGLVLRLETLLRRSLPISGNYDAPQSHLKPPFEPAKAGRYMTTSRL